ncbi:MAG TPA: metalloregulator ArsR/SmtB family transcription factor [Candidatus Limnocylindria bacterium]
MATRAKGTTSRRAEFEHYAAVYAALSEPVRMEVIRLIQGVEELPCTVLAATLPISKSTISYHIKILYHAELISVRKDGRNYHYTLRRDVFESYVPGFLGRLEGSRKVEIGRRRSVQRTAAAVA